MKLKRLLISNFQSFGQTFTEISLSDLTFLIGPNGCGKTAILQAICRLFAFDPALRRVQRSDFHVPIDEEVDARPDERHLWIEAHFLFPELADTERDHTAFPPHFAHMRLNATEEIPEIVFRLEATLASDGEIEDVLYYVLEADEAGPTVKHPVHRAERANIQIHYLPARRDPTDHVAYTAKSLLGRALRAVNWGQQQNEIKEASQQLNEGLESNIAVGALSDELSTSWQTLYRGTFFENAKVSFSGGDMESLLRGLTIAFKPGHGEESIDFSRLSDGEKSLLYLSLVLSIQKIGRTAWHGNDELFDVGKLSPALFTMFAMEEPENSLAPHYLGRIVKELADAATNDDCQSLIATHAPSLLKRIPPEDIRYLRLDTNRRTEVASIRLPSAQDAAFKFVREAVQSFPELYFSRLVVLGEGDSEEIVVPRLVKARGLGMDEAAISVVPLGGRHVHHFWLLLTSLGIPFVTLLDLDLARNQGGWGRVRYVSRKLHEFFPGSSDITETELNAFPSWNDETQLLLEMEDEHGWLAFLETKDVFFATPLDLDFAMLEGYPTAYQVSAPDRVVPTDNIVKAVFGGTPGNVNQYTFDQRQLFEAYHKRFKLRSKPAAHLAALSELSDEQLANAMPATLRRLVDRIEVKLRTI
jgi:putative ATP-dependent endonuclease of OLD family